MFQNLSGIIGRIFRIGYGNLSVALSVNDSNELEPSSNVNMGSHDVILDHDPTIDNGASRKQYVDTQVANATDVMRDYTDRAIGAIQPADESLVTIPNRLYAGDLADGYENILGTVKENRFIYQVIFEILQPFNVEKDYYISIGTVKNHEFLVPQFKVSDKLQSTFIIDICKTVTADTELLIFVTEIEEPLPPFEQGVVNPHTDTTYSLTSDASGNVWTVGFAGENLPTELSIFNEVIGKVDIGYGVMDFGITLPPNVNYRIVEQNSALDLIEKGTAEELGVSKVDGIWTRESEMDASDVMTYKFILDQSSGDLDYRHIYLYDRDSDEPDVAIRSYHIKNELNFVAPFTTDETLRTIFTSANEAAVGVVENDDGSFTVTATGEVTDVADGLGWGEMDCKATSLAVFYPYDLPDGGVTITSINPGLAHLSDQSDITINDEGQSVFVETFKDDNNRAGCWLGILLSDDTSYDITVTVSNPDKGDDFVVHVKNDLTFKEDEPQETVGTDVVLMNSRNLIARAPLAAAPVGEGASRILILVI